MHLPYGGDDETRSGHCAILAASERGVQWACRNFAVRSPLSGSSACCANAIPLNSMTSNLLPCAAGGCTAPRYGSWATYCQEHTIQLRPTDLRGHVAVAGGRNLQLWWKVHCEAAGCPRCSAAAGHPCTSRGMPRRSYHQERLPHAQQLWRDRWQDKGLCRECGAPRDDGDYCEPHATRIRAARLASQARPAGNQTNPGLG
jgi:hypothetical protein